MPGRKRLGGCARGEKCGGEDLESTSWVKADLELMADLGPKAQRAVLAHVVAGHKAAGLAVLGGGLDWAGLEDVVGSARGARVGLAEKRGQIG